MQKKKYIQLILFKNFQQEKSIVEEWDHLSFKDLIKIAEEWKNANPNKNTIKINFDPLGCDNIECNNCKK